MKVRETTYRMWMIAAVLTGLIALAALAGCSRQRTASSPGSSGAGPSKPTPQAQPMSPGQQPTQNKPVQGRVAAYKVNMTPGNQFAPQQITAPAGSTVNWVNIDKSKPHTVTADSQGGPNSDSRHPDGIGPGASWSWTLPSNAVSGAKYYYHCRYHGTAGNGRSMGSGMSGVVIVR